MRAAGVAALLALAAASPAPQTASPPELTPTRDVDVTYRALANGAPVQQRSRFDPQSGRIRIDTPSPGLYVLINRGAHTMDLVSDGDRSVLQMPYDASHVGGVPADRAYQRLGADTILGAPCTEWRSQEAGGEPLTFCITDDGVLLRARRGANVVVEAVSLAYGPIPDKVFSVPPGFARHPAAHP